MRRLTTLLASCLALFTIVVPGCAADTGDGDEDDHETEPETASTDSALSSNVDCRIRNETGYVKGSPRPVRLFTIGGKPVSIAVGHQYLKMKKAATAAGAPLSIRSGFRTMAEQQYFYRCYQTGSCNHGHKAARPGFSNHQGGFALDLEVSPWLQRNAERFGFFATVRGEAWHYEYHGPDPGGPCSGGGGGGDEPITPAGGGGTCQSFTLGRDVPTGTCVQREDDQKWYVCENGDWPVVSGPASPQCTSCPQIGRCP
jgi:hypothetical protein